MATDSECYSLKNCVATFSRLFLMGSCSYLRVMMTYIRAWMSLKFGQIRPRTTKLTALKRLKNCCFHFFLTLYNGSQVSIVALWATCFYFAANSVSKQLFVFVCHGYYNLNYFYISIYHKDVVKLCLYTSSLKHLHVKLNISDLYLYS